VTSLFESDVRIDFDAHDDFTGPADRPRETRVQQLNTAFASVDAVERLQLLRESVVGTLLFTTSFGLEDQVLTHLLTRSGITVDYVTLDTGRLFPETYQVWAATEQRYGIRIRGYYPDAAAIEALVNRQGIDGFYASQAARKSCCGVRKVEPLRRALLGVAGWITGMRADQSEFRQGLEFVSYDSEHQVVKANPLLDWSRDAVAALVAAEQIPSSPLHERGFLSIGCAPCTRAVAPGEAERAGRWWWENEPAKECGLHLTADGRLVRAK
jgi:phosphoadenosine phosphosulfate reductase